MLVTPERTRLWRHPDFMRLWLGQTISELGSGLGALSLTAILLLAATPAQMGLLAALGGAPVLLVGLQAGVWVDRLRRRPMLIAADLLRALLLLSVPLAWWLQLLRIEQLYAVTFLAGSLTVLFNVAHQSLLPSLVPREQIVAGNARLGVSGNIAEIIAPGAGGLLVQIVTAPIAVLVDALSFVVSALCIWRIRAPEPAPAPRAGPPPPMWREIGAGLRVILGHPILRTLGGSLAVSRLFGSFYGAVYSLYLIRTLGLSPVLMGMTIGAGGAGALAGSLLTTPITRRWGVGPVLIGTAVVEVAVAPLIPLAGGPLLLAFGMIVVAQFVGDAAGAIYGIGERSLRQLLTPPRLLGRANATTHFLVESLSTVGMLAGGILASAIGIRPTVWLTTIGRVLALVWLLWSPVRHLHEYATSMESEEAV